MKTKYHTFSPFFVTSGSINAFLSFLKLALIRRAACFQHKIVGVSPTNWDGTKHVDVFFITFLRDILKISSHCFNSCNSLHYKFRIIFQLLACVRHCRRRCSNIQQCLRQECATRGPGAEVLWAVERHRLKQALRFLMSIADLPRVANELSNPHSLTHAAAARGPIWLCAFGPEVLHGCTPLASDIFQAGRNHFCLLSFQQSFDNVDNRTIGLTISIGKI